MIHADRFYHGYDSFDDIFASRINDYCISIKLPSVSYLGEIKAHPLFFCRKSEFTQ